MQEERFLQKLMMKEEKLHTISIMRVMAMLMIVAYHSMLYYTDNWWQLGGPTIPFWVKTAGILNAIDLPMFVFISGILFGYLYITKDKYRNKKQFIIKKFRRLIIPYIFWGIFLIIAMPSLNKAENLFTGIGHLWFLLMLFEVFIIVILWARFLCIKASQWHIVLIYICLCISFALYHTYSSHHFFLCIYATLFYLPAFLLGICCIRFRFQDLIPIKYTKIVFFGALVLLFTYFYLSNSGVSFLIDYVIQMLTGYTIVVCSYILLSKRDKSGKGIPTIITHIDKLSMGIYIFNQIVINAFTMIPEVRLMLCKHYFIGVPILFTIGLAIPYLLALLFSKNKYLKWTIG